MDQTRNKNGGPLVSYMKKLEVYLYYFFIWSWPFYVVYVFSKRKVFVQISEWADVWAELYVLVYVSWLLYIYCLVLHGKCFFGNKNLNLICKVAFPLKVLGYYSHKVFDNLIVTRFDWHWLQETKKITQTNSGLCSHFIPLKTLETLWFSDVFRG